MYNNACFIAESIYQFRIVISMICSLLNNIRIHRRWNVPFNGLQTSSYDITMGENEGSITRARGNLKPIGRGFTLCVQEPFPIYILARS